MEIVRICSEHEATEGGFAELTKLLIKHDRPEMINAEISTVIVVPQAKA